MRASEDNGAIMDAESVKLITEQQASELEGDDLARAYYSLVMGVPEGPHLTDELTWDYYLDAELAEGVRRGWYSRGWDCLFDPELEGKANTFGLALDFMGHDQELGVELGVTAPSERTATFRAAVILAIRERQRSVTLREQLVAKGDDPDRYSGQDIDVLTGKRFSDE